MRRLAQVLALLLCFSGVAHGQNYHEREAAGCALSTSTPPPNQGNHLVAVFRRPRLAGGVEYGGGSKSHCAFGVPSGYEQVAETLPWAIVGL